MSPARPAAVVVLAAGEGTRMKSSIPKVLHQVGGRALVHHAVLAARALEPEHLVVVGHGRDEVIAHLGEVAPGVQTAVQDQQHGTGHAALCALEALPPLTGTVVVTYGDAPLLTADTLHDLLEEHQVHGDAVTVLTAVVPDPTGYGRVIRDSHRAVTLIVEQKDATEEELAVREINSGVYAFQADALRDGLGRLDTDNAQG